MFVQCPRCRSLVAVDAASGAAPDYCPYCDGPLAEAGPASAESATEADIFAERADNAPVMDADPAPASAPDDIRAEAPAQAFEATDREHAAPAIAEGVAIAEGIVVAGEAPTLTADAEADHPADAVPEGASAPADMPASEPAPETASPAKPKPRKKKANAPSFARRTQRAAERPTPPWLWAIAAGLALLAGLQIVLADRAELAADARFRPAIVSLCATLGCSIPAWREPAAFAMLEREVRQHPYMPGALRVDAAFRNNARWAQPWPDLVLTLSDVDGRPLGMRTFSPKEYLGDKITQKEIGSGQTAAVRMEVMEPAPGVVAFSFDFR